MMALENINVSTIKIPIDYCKWESGCDSYIARLYFKNLPISYEKLMVDILYFHRRMLPIFKEVVLELREIINYTEKMFRRIKNPMGNYEFNANCIDLTLFKAKTRYHLRVDLGSNKNPWKPNPIKCLTSKIEFSPLLDNGESFFREICNTLKELNSLNQLK